MAKHKTYELDVYALFGTDDCRGDHEGACHSARFSEQREAEKAALTLANAYKEAFAGGFLLWQRVTKITVSEVSGSDIKQVYYIPVMPLTPAERCYLAEKET